MRIQTRVAAHLRARSRARTRPTRHPRPPWCDGYMEEAHPPHMQSVDPCASPERTWTPTCTEAPIHQMHDIAQSHIRQMHVVLRPYQQHPGESVRYEQGLEAFTLA